MKYTKIKVYITKHGSFMAQIHEDKKKRYELLVGGSDWNRGKGLVYHDRILSQCNSKLNTIIRLFEKNKYSYESHE